MFSSNTNPSHRPPRPKRLYIRRSIQITQESLPIIHQINIKRVHLRKINEMVTTLNYTPNQLNQHQSIHKKLLKSVSHLSLATTTGKCWAESLKTAKRVKEFIISTDDIGSRPSHIPSYLKRLSKNVKSISLYIEKYTEDIHLSSFYQILNSIKRFKNLEYFGREFQIMSPWKVFEEEAKIMERYIRRLPQANIFKYEQFFSDENGMKAEIAKGKVNNHVTGLCFSILEQSDRPSDELLYYLEKEEDLLSSAQTNLGDDEAVGFESIGDIRPEGRIAEELLALKEAIKPFYQFALFPGLQKLDLVIAEDLYPLDAFLCEGFASLKNLTCLQLKVMNRPFGSIFLFKALLELPKLSYLDFKFSYIQGLELELFCQFLQDQKELIDLKLSLKNGESSRIRQDYGPLKVLKTLNGMQKLKNLSLIFPNYSILSFSEILENVRRISQLQTLEINASNDSPDWSLKDIEGLCRFIRRQKESITRLNLIINLEEISMINQLTRTIAELKRLRGLKIDFGEIYENLKEKEKRGIVEILKGLENLEYLYMGLKRDGEWYVETIKGLRDLKGLRRLDIELVEGVIGSEYERKVGLELVKMKNVKKIVVEVDERIDEELRREGILEMVQEFNKKQSLRCDLMF